MYLNMNGNVAAVCVVASKPEYREEVGERKMEMTKVYAKCKESTPDGPQVVNLDLLFYGGLAIPAMKISSGMTLIVFGRESPKERFTKGKYTLERSLFVTGWSARDIDPLGNLEELKVRREIKTRDRELKETFWEWLNLPQIKSLLNQWFLEFLEGYKESMKRNANNSEKGEIQK